MAKDIMQKYAHINRAYKILQEAVQLNAEIDEEIWAAALLAYAVKKYIDFGVSHIDLCEILNDMKTLSKQYIERGSKEGSSPSIADFNFDKKSFVCK